MQFRTEWQRYTKGSDVIIFVVDANNVNNYLTEFSFSLKNDYISVAKKELFHLLEDTDLHGIPILIVGNKIDLKPHLKE